MATAPVSQQLAPSMVEAANQYERVIREVIGQAAVSLTLYGRVTTPAFDERRHTARSVLLLKQIDLGTLQQLAKHGVALGKLKFAAPVIMTTEYIKESLDTFPLELLEIASTGNILFGDNHFADLTFEDSHIRLQTERELKTSLIGMRQGLLASTGQEKLLGALVMDIGEGLLRPIRGLLWLQGHRETMDVETMLSKTEIVVAAKINGVRSALNPSEPHGWKEFEQLYADAESLGKLTNDL